MEIEESLSEKLHHREVVLTNVSDILRFSFIVQKSLSCLNLEICQKLMVPTCKEETSSHCAFKCAKYFINTEEKCRKYFTPSRNLLYNFHLDLPKGRELHLNRHPNNLNCTYYEDSPHIAKIIPFFAIYDIIIYNFIPHVFNVNCEKLKILKWIFKMIVPKSLLFIDFSTIIAKRSIELFFLVIKDAELFKNFLMYLDLKKWLKICTSLEPLLCNIHRLGGAELNEEDCGSIFHKYIAKYRFEHISPLLKYTNAPKFSTIDYLDYSIAIMLRTDVTVDLDFEIENGIQLQRMYLILQLAFVYFVARSDCGHDIISDALRLIWCSVPYPYISFEEMRTSKIHMSAKELENMYDYYARIVGEFHEWLQPRSLQHLCRTVIRRTLRENRYWIPVGIRKLRLSKPFESFLNLEKTSVTCLKFEVQSRSELT